MPAAMISLAAHRQSGSALHRAGEVTGRRERPAVSAAAPACDLAIVANRAAFDALEGEWNALFDRAGRDTQLFQQFNWLWHWCNHYLPDSGSKGPRISIVTGRRNGRLVMVWPLVSERAGGLSVLSWMGQPVSQYGDVLVDDAEDAASLLRDGWRFISSNLNADVVQLRKVRADAAIAPLLSELGAVSTEKLEAPCLDLSSAPSFAEYEKRYSSGARRNRKRQRRRLEERGAVTIEAHSQGEEAVRLARIAVDLKRTWLSDKGLLSPALADDRFGAFFADVARGDRYSTGCRVLAITCDGVAAALEIGFACKGRAAIHVIVYDRAFEKAAAGALLMEESIRRSCEAGFKTFDLLAPAAPYKSDWADGAIEVNDWFVPLSFAGQAYGHVYLGFLRSVVKKALALLPPGLRRVVAGGLARR